MQLKLKGSKVANVIGIGDKHDLSIEWFITNTDYPVYVIKRVGDRFEISGAEEIEEKKNEKPRKTNEKKQANKPKPRGTNGKRVKTGKSRK